VVSCGIWQTGKICRGKLWSLLFTLKAHSQTTIRVDRKDQGDRVAGALGAHWVWVGESFFLNFQLKIQGFMHFYCRKTYSCDQKLGLGGLIDTLGAEDVKLVWRG